MMRTYLYACLATLAAVLVAGCGGEPQRGEIKKEVETFENSDQVFREWEYYLNSRGQKIAHGMLTQYHSNSEIRFQVMHKDGKYDGLYKQFYATGKPEFVAAYKDGFLHGKLEKYHPNGELAVKGQNVKGLQDGEWVYYDETGEVERTERWKKGKKLE